MKKQDLSKKKEQSKKTKIDEYKNKKNELNINTNKTTRRNSSLLHKLLRNNNSNLHNLVIDNMKLNNNIENDLFDQIKNKRRNRIDYRNSNKSQVDDDISEKYLEKKNKDFDNKLISLYRLHSSKFHLDEGNSKNINDIIKMEIINLKNEKVHKYKILQKNDYILDNHEFKKMNDFRKKMAFYYRFINHPLKSRSLQKNIEIQNQKFNKILHMSKTKQNLLLFNMKLGKNNNKNIDQSCDNCKEKNSLLSPFKGNRFSGKIYDYYKSNNWLIKDNYVFPESKCKNNDNNIYEEINSINNEDHADKVDSKCDKKKIKNNRINSSISNKKKIIQLNSLLLK